MVAMAAATRPTWEYETALHIVSLYMATSNIYSHFSSLRRSNITHALLMGKFIELPPLILEKLRTYVIHNCKFSWKVIYLMSSSLINLYTVSMWYIIISFLEKLFA